MCILLMAFLLQANPPQRGVAMGKAPATIGAQPPPQAPASAPVISKPRTFTTPDIDPNAELTHTQMAENIGSQGAEITEITRRVGDLERLRIDPDRKDIDDLKDTKKLILLFCSFCGGVLSLLWFLRNSIWTDMVRPRIIRSLSDTPRAEPPVSTST